MNDERKLKIKMESDCDIGLVYLALKKMKLMSRFEDFYDVGLIGLANGIKTFDKSKGVKKSTYYMACIQNELKKALHAERAQKRYLDNYLLSLDAIVTEEGDTLSEFVSDPDVDVEKDALTNVQISQLRYCIGNTLNNKEYILIYLRYYEDKSVKELSEIYKVSVQTIMVKLRKIKAKLRIAMLNVGDNYEF